MPAFGFHSIDAPRRRAVGEIRILGLLDGLGLYRPD